MPNSWTSVIAIISLAISCFVAYIEYLNYSLNRLNLIVKFGSNQQEQIVFYNLSMIDAMITHWELVWVTRRYLFFQEEEDIHLYEGYENLHINVKARSREVHTIHEQYSGIIMGGPIDSKLYIRIFIAGKQKPIIKFLTRGFVSKAKAGENFHF